MTGCEEASSYVSMDEEKMDHNVESTNVDVFDNRPSKKAKCSESSVLDDPLPSPTILTSSLVPGCSESIGSESDNKKNGDPLSSPTSPTLSSLSPVSELIEETVSKDDDKQTVSEDDDKQPEDPLNNVNVVIYDYLPQDYTLTEQDDCAHCAILDSPEKDVLVLIDDISLKKRELLCLLDESKWLDDEVIGAYTS